MKFHITRYRAAYLLAAALLCLILAACNSPGGGMGTTGSGEDVTEPAPDSPEPLFLAEVIAAELKNALLTAGKAESQGSADGAGSRASDTDHDLSVTPEQADYICRFILLALSASGQLESENIVELLTLIVTSAARSLTLAGVTRQRHIERSLRIIVKSAAASAENREKYLPDHSRREGMTTGGCPISANCCQSPIIPETTPHPGFSRTSATPPSGTPSARHTAPPWPGTHACFRAPSWTTSSGMSAISAASATCPDDPAFPPLQGTVFQAGPAGAPSRQHLTARAQWSAAGPVSPAEQLP